MKKYEDKVILTLEEYEDYENALAALAALRQTTFKEEVKP